MIEFIALFLVVGAFYALGYRRVSLVVAVLTDVALIFGATFWQGGVNSFVLFSPFLALGLYAYGVNRREWHDCAARRAQKNTQARADYLNVIFAQADDPSAEHVVAIVTDSKKV